MHDETLETQVLPENVEQAETVDSIQTPPVPVPNFANGVDLQSSVSQLTAVAPRASRGINFGLLAWSFILIMLGVLLVALPFVHQPQPLTFAIAALAITGVALLVIAIFAAAREYLQKRKS